MYFIVSFDWCKISVCKLQEGKRRIPYVGRLVYGLLVVVIEEVRGQSEIPSVKKFAEVSGSLSPAQLLCPSYRVRVV